MLRFEKANLTHRNTVFRWLEEPHIKEFWDNSQEHKDYILHFMRGIKNPSPYFDSVFTYWIGIDSINSVPYSLIMTSPLDHWVRDMPARTVTLDFMIGNPDYLGKGLASPTRQSFMDFYVAWVDKDIRAFSIDPYEKNVRAIHVYERCGFRRTGQYVVEQGFFEGHTNLMMMKEVEKSPNKNKP